MIKTSYGKTNATGSISELLADYSSITCSLFEGLEPELGEEDAKKMLKDAFERGFMTEEEKEDRLKEKVDELKNFLKGIANLLEDETEEGDQ